MKNVWRKCLCLLLQDTDQTRHPPPPSHPPPTPQTQTNGDYQHSAPGSAGGVQESQHTMSTLPVGAQSSFTSTHGDHGASLDRNVKPPLAPKPDKEKKRGSVFSIFKKKEKDKK